MRNAKEKWSNLPAALRYAAVIAVVFALAAALTAVRHNASTYLTGVWDTGSQELIFGRVHQMEQGQRAVGGFLGVYTLDWDDVRNRDWFRDGEPTEELDYNAYTHQSGLQGWMLGMLNRGLCLWDQDGLARENALYAVNSTLFYAAELFVALAVLRELGVLPAVFWMAAVLLAPWLQRGMKDLYWSMWTWMLPLLAVLLLIYCTQQRGKTPRWCWLAVALACMVRCMCGFEFITTFLILCEIPLCYAAAKARFVNRDPAAARAWFGRIVGAGASALGGVAAALGIWFWQECRYFGDVSAAWQSMGEAITNRISLTDDDVLDVTVLRVLRQYFIDCSEPLLQLGSVEITVMPLLLAVLACLAVCGVLLCRRGAGARLVPSALVWLLSLAAPASWMVLSKAHAAIHSHLVPMLWHFAFVPVSCMLLPVLAKELIAGRKKDLVASH